MQLVEDERAVRVVDGRVAGLSPLAVTSASIVAWKSGECVRTMIS